MATARSAASTLKPKGRTPRVPVAPARRPGRPTGSARGPEQRARLIDVALELFARRGILDTTLGEIAREAGFTPAMVHYYFKTREQLIDVLIDERFVPLRVEIGSPFEAHPDDPVAGITQLARRLVDVSSRYPWFPALWIREVITEGGLLRQRMFERFGDAHQRASVAAIARWQKAGRLNPEIEPSLVFLTVLGLTILPLATSKMWRNDPVRKSLTADDIARHAVALLTHGAGPLGA
ncbi:TetR/AcrR family transcriptional regulator [Paraburkholderia acidicola]|uniref:TetR/AcrR family transcriptional regulator n=1 Tax=Paraburkholderia acidicola TaxID=1912599 RepID=UPI000BBB9C1B|nr:TetR/AcrR family transcriptional regulator [Paraburkholderia acidicola]